MDKVSGFILPIGVALVVLVYTSLAVLAFSTARADHRFAERNIAYNVQYYRVEGDFEKTVAAIHEATLKASGEDRAQQVRDHVESLEKVRLLSNDQESFEFLYADLVSPHVLFKGQFKIKDEKIEVISKGLTNTEEWKEQRIELWKGSDDGN